MTELTRRSMLTSAVAASAATGLAPVTSLTGSAFAAAPPASKQVPSIYRYKVGSHEITVVADGVTQGALPDTYVVNAAKNAVNAAITANYMPADKITHYYTPVVINTGSKLVAIDTGVGLGAYEQSKGRVGQYHANLAAAGIDRNAIDVVIISHMHTDHINGLLGPDNKLAFPNAEVMVPAPDWAFWTDESNAGKVPEHIKGQFANVKRVFSAFNNKVTQYTADKELVPGIVSAATPGHTPGHMSHIVSSGSERVLVQADITAGITSLFINNPGWHLMWDLDRPVAEQTRRKMYDMAATDKVLVQAFHAPFPSVGYVEKSGNGYRWIPATWNPAI